MTDNKVSIPELVSLCSVIYYSVTVLDFVLQPCNCICIMMQMSLWFPDSKCSAVLIYRAVMQWTLLAGI